MLQACRLSGEKSGSLQLNVVELQVNSNTMEVLLAEANQSKTSLLSALVSVTVCSIDWSALTGQH